MTHTLATAGTQSGGGSSALIWFIPLILLAVMFLMNRRRQQRMRQAQNDVQIGDEVTTTSGLLGRLVEIDEKVGTIEAAPGVRLRYDRRAILPVSYTAGSTTVDDADPAQQSAPDGSASTIDTDKKA